jgi:hypothetical protein
MLFHLCRIFRIVVVARYTVTLVRVDIQMISCGCCTRVLRLLQDSQATETPIRDGRGSRV